jgi:hypothetical protein
MPVAERNAVKNRAAVPVRLAPRMVNCRLNP